MHKPFFAQCYLQFRIGKHLEGVVAMVSETGAIRIQFQEISYSKVAALSGRSLEVILTENLKLQGKIFKEVNVSGYYYRLQFEKLDSVTETALKTFIERQKFPAPWQRKFERFQSSTETYSQCDHPDRAFLTNKQSKFTLKVIDYCKDGMLLETSGSPEYTPWHIGASVQLDLTTNQNKVIRAIEGIVVRISESYDRELNQSIYRYGIFFNENNFLSIRRYQDLVAETESLASAKLHIAA